MGLSNISMFDLWYLWSNTINLREIQAKYKYNLIRKKVGGAVLWHMN